MRLIGKEEYAVDVRSEDHRDKLREYVQALFKRGGIYTFKMTPYKRKRSNPQNRYLWGVVYPLMAAGFRDLGWQYDEEMVHFKMKQAFLTQTLVNEKTGEVETVLGSTKELDTDSMTTFIENVKMWASENLQVVIPDPYNG